MVIKLHGSGISTCTRRVATVLREKKIPFELINVDLLHGEHKSAPYLAKQPFGQVPYIDDDGFILFESRAICRYLEEKYHSRGVKLIPDDPKAKALFEQAASAEAFNFDFYASKAAAVNVFRKMQGLEPDLSTFDSLIAELTEKLDGYEAILSKQKYLAGNDITLADLFHLPYGALLEVGGCRVLYDKSRPNILRWWADISSRETWQAVKDGVIEPNA